ncbi:MAG: DNA mismatch repair protein MutS [Prevotellaceae bacterium]|jgi:DNA mismatch repair protein MutS|nr:DNA mismatch repair protein MutS [Prevotellaceae bacterium]
MVFENSTPRKNYVETPLMKQYMAIKAQHPDAILLFRVGDFYETFGEDAIRTSEILGITLTRRANGAAAFVELAGFPYHAIDTYLSKLVRAGQRVAICDQLENPKFAKKIVKRGVTELVTPGVAYNDNVLSHRENNFLACVHLAEHCAGVAFLDVSTGEFHVAQGSVEYVDKLLSNYAPKEVLYQKGREQPFAEAFGTKYYTYRLDEWSFSPEATCDKLLKHFGTSSLKGFGIDKLEAGIVAAGAVLFYLELTQHDRLKHIAAISRVDEDHYVWLDKFTIRNLELFASVNENARTLIDVIDKTISPMGARLLKRWVAMPLKEVQLINARLNVVDYFLQHAEEKEKLISHLYEIGDLERLISKAATGRILPREVIQLKKALEAIKPIKQYCLSTQEATLQTIGEQLQLCESMHRRIMHDMAPEPANQIGKGLVIGAGVNDELDELRDISRHSKNYLLEVQQREAQRTAIPSLKVSFNNVFGYYIEVRNTHKHKVPDNWIRKQTLTDAERYITQELKQYEEKILGAEERILAIEQQLFNELVVSLLDYMAPVQLNASLIAQLDCLLSFTAVADGHGYCKPTVNTGCEIDIRQGRHPVIERLLPAGETYVANDVRLDDKAQQIIIITGPNMSGKSALLRQTALIVLLAQIGSFVPAEAATIGMVDKIFTRVGASDNISQGESTFMVEMNESASILHNLSSRSLILLDEIGRGTSTYDGISIAWAMVEYIHEHPAARAKTLFATHYHELNEMEERFSRVKNYHVSVRETDNHVIFLRKLQRGGVEHSFGIHVAKMAGMPVQVVRRADEMLKELETQRRSSASDAPVSSENKQPKAASSLSGKIAGQAMQLSFFQLDDPVLTRIRDELRNLDINTLSPLDAFDKLREIKKMVNDV